MSRALLVLAVALAGPAAASQHYFVYRAEARRCPAFIDVAGIGPTILTVEWFGPRTTGAVQTDIDGNTLMASVDLAQAGLLPGELALVRVAIAAPLPSFAMLRTLHGATPILDILRGGSTGFIVPVGSLDFEPTLLVGNPNGEDVVINLQSGPENIPQQLIVPAGSAIEIPLAVPGVSYTLTTIGSPQPEVVVALATAGNDCHDHVAQLNSP